MELCSVHKNEQVQMAMNLESSMGYADAAEMLGQSGIP